MKWVVGAGIFPPPLPPQEYGGFNDSVDVSPSVLLIIIILAVVFFISGLVHLLIRVLLRPPIRAGAGDGHSATALQGQLQHLFQLHDCGVDQSFIDALPVFDYRDIVGVGVFKDPFDCAVCLCEFESEERLRLLPKCSHAFHVECIDTWLLSHSTCPLCRASLLPEFPQAAGCGSEFSFSPVVVVVESRGESFREIGAVSDGENGGFGRSSRLGSWREELRRISGETEDGEKVVRVKLGKFKNVDGGECSRSDENSGESSARRCFSMGSFAYVMDENPSLQVPIKTPAKRAPPNKKPSLPPLTPGHRHASSDSGRRSEAFREPSSGRAVSFHFPAPAALKNARRTSSEIQIRRWGNEITSPEHDEQLAKQPSLARTTLLWFIGKHNRSAVHSFSGNNNV